MLVEGQKCLSSHLRHDVDHDGDAGWVAAARPLGLLPELPNYAFKTVAAGTHQSSRRFKLINVHIIISLFQLNLVSPLGRRLVLLEGRLDVEFSGSQIAPFLLGREQHDPISCNVHEVGVLIAVFG